MSSTVAKRSAEAERIVTAGAKGRALMGGTEAMRSAGKTYLPKFDAESETNYDARLKSSWLFNGYKKTVQDMAGRVFAKPVELGDGAPDAVVTLAKNIDNQGHDLSTFARGIFEEALAGGIPYVMVDAPPRVGTVTKAEAEEQNLRPYWVHIKTESVLGYKTAIEHNLPILTQFRIMECIKIDDPKDEFAEIEIEQVRVLDRTEAGVQTRLYRKGDKEEWVAQGEPTLSGMSEITVVPLRVNPHAVTPEQPLLDDLADVNVAHWQSQSDQRHILHFARVPILHVSGRRPDEAPLTISASSAITSESSDAKIEWVEHTGQAIGAGRQDLKDLEFQMEAHGLQLLVARPGGQSATGEALDAAKETSILSMTADELKDVLEQAMKWTVDYLGVGDNSVEVKVNKEFGVTMMDAQRMTALLSAVNTGNLSRETFIAELSRCGMISPDVDTDEEIERIGDNAESLMQAPPANERQ